MPRLASITTQQLTVAGVSIPLDTTPRYVSLALDSTDYNEGDTVTATLTTAYVDDDVTVGYTLTGVSANDLSAGSTTGTFTIASNSASATFTLDTDGLTEGVDTFVITLAATDSEDTATGSLTDSATVQDTSNDPTRTPWLDDNDDIITVAQIISPVAMQVNAVFAINPSVPINVEGRTSGTTTTIINITANTGSIIEVDDNGNSTNFIVGEELNITV